MFETNGKRVSFVLFRFLFNANMFVKTLLW